MRTRPFRNPTPPSSLWEQWGTSDWLAPSSMTPAHAPPSSAQGVTPVLLVVRGFAAQPSLPPRARGAEIPLIIWLCPYGRTRMIQRRSAWIDVFVPRYPEIRLLGFWASGGARLLSRTVPSSLSLSPHVYPSIVFFSFGRLPLMRWRFASFVPARRCRSEGGCSS